MFILKYTFVCVFLFYSLCVDEFACYILLLRLSMRNVYKIIIVKCHVTLLNECNLFKNITDIKNTAIKFVAALDDIFHDKRGCCPEF